ncbi:MAG: TrmH family RNA methyltransferase [Saprospiraceae bacterium]|nr:TrmH family RNA methyltransferase [Saprospiraceae bacterium]
MVRKKELEELNRISSEEFIQSQKFPLILCADNIRSGHNIGSLFRIADAFRIESLLLGPQCAKPPHPEILKTALGAQHHVSWKLSQNLAEDLNVLKAEGYQLLGIEQTIDSIALHQYPVDLNSKYVLILGHEINGIDQSIIELLDACLEIPQFGVKHSLNVSVAAGIACWQICSRFM